MGSERLNPWFAVPRVFTVVMHLKAAVTVAGPQVYCSHTSRLTKGPVNSGCSSALRRKITTIVFPGENVSLIPQYPLPFILIHVDTGNLFDDGYKEDTSMTSEKALIKSYKFKLVCSGVIYHGPGPPLPCSENYEIH